MCGAAGEFRSTFGEILSSGGFSWPVPIGSPSVCTARVKLLLAAVVALGVATTGIAIAGATPASAAATPVLQNTIGAYNLSAVIPAGGTGATSATLSAAVANPSTATTLSFTSISTSYAFSPVGDVDVTSAACGLDIFSYTGNPFTVSGTSLASGGTGVTGVSLVYAQNSPTCAIPTSSAVFQAGTPTQTYALQLVTGGSSTVNPASLTITAQPPITDGYAQVNTSTGIITMQPEATASGNFNATYAYCAPGVTLTSDPSGLSDGNCSTGTITYTLVPTTSLVGESVTVSISSSTIYEAVSSAIQAPRYVAKGQTFTYTQAPKTSLIPVEESTSIGTATIQYADNFASIQPVPAGLTYVPGSLKTIGGDNATFGVATAKYCTSADIGLRCPDQYRQLQDDLSLHRRGARRLDPHQRRLAGDASPRSRRSSWRAAPSAPAPAPRSTSSRPAPRSTSRSSDPTPPPSTPTRRPAASYTTSGNTSGCPTRGTPAYAAPTPTVFTTITAGVTGVTTPGGSASGNDAGGSTVQISGTGFTGATAVDFGSTPATSFVVNSGSSITAVAPGGADGTVDVTVVNGGNPSPTSSADQFTFAPPGVPDAPSGIQVTPGDGNPGRRRRHSGLGPDLWRGFPGDRLLGLRHRQHDARQRRSDLHVHRPDGQLLSLSGLTNGDSYTFSVTAANTDGSGPAGSVTVTEGAPSAPTGASPWRARDPRSVSFGAPATSGDGSPSAAIR